MMNQDNNELRRGVLIKFILEAINDLKVASASSIFTRIVNSCPHANIPAISASLSNLYRRRLISREKRNHYRITSDGHRYLIALIQKSELKKQRLTTSRSSFSKEVRKAIKDYIERTGYADYYAIRAYLMSIYPDRLEAVGYLPIHLRKLTKEGHIRITKEGFYESVNNEQTEELIR